MAGGGAELQIGANVPKRVLFNPKTLCINDEYCNL